MTNIQLHNISKVYAGPTGAMAVNDVSIEIASGEFFFLLGPSGCGKTTLLRIIAGLVEPTGGRVLFNDRDVTNLPVERRNTAMVFQNYALWPHMTVMQNVEFGPKMKGLDSAKRREVAGENLHRVQMDDYGRRKPSQLSGGQQQRIALARALAAQGDCLLLDEPLSNLDARLRLHMRGQLRQLVKSTGTTAVYVTHDQKEALSMADRIAVMNAGQIVQVGRPQEIYDAPANHFVADFLGEANFMAGKIAGPGGPLGTGASAPAGASVQTEVGTVLTRPIQAPAGTSATICIRPERIRIAAVPADAKPTIQAGQTVLPAKIVSTMYLGELRQYTCRLRDTTTWRVYILADRDQPLHEGQEVMLSLAAEDVSCWAE